MREQGPQLPGGLHLLGDETHLVLLLAVRPIIDLGLQVVEDLDHVPVLDRSDVGLDARVRRLREAVGGDHPAGEALVLCG